jgi:molybdopterin molybdotransferase/putative molybdopterin biosynthesis protein
MTRIMAETRLRVVRLARGLSQSTLAKHGGISRQALSAIESGAYQPGVGVALRLAQALGQTVESLFGAGEEGPHLSATLAGERRRPTAHGAVGQRVALGRVGDRIVALTQPAAALNLAAACGIVERVSGFNVEVASLRSGPEIDSRLLIAGCDPAVAILNDWLSRHHAPAGAFASSCSSRAALSALRAGRVHAAGVHVRDPRSGEYNLALARGALKRRRGMLINFARWELGLAVAAGNPLAIRGVADLARSRPRVRLVNREPGSGARLALDEALEELGLSPRKIEGYEREAAGHLEVAAAIARGDADLGVTIRVGAKAYGLDFIGLREERYDLVIPQAEADTAPVRAMLDALNSSRFTRELSALCFYDTARSGEVIARFG